MDGLNPKCTLNPGKYEAPTLRYGRSVLNFELLKANEPLSSTPQAQMSRVEFFAVQGLMFMV